MTTPFCKSLLLLLLLLPSILCAQSVPSKPEPAKFVNDYARLFSTNDAKVLELKLQQYDQNSSTQIVVATINTINEYQSGSIEELANTWADRWGIGQQGTDNGLFVLISKNDRKVRIETGYGLEGYLPDLRANQLIEQYLIPQFKQGKYYEGVDQLTDALIRFTEGGFSESDRYRGGEGSGDMLVVAIIIGGVITLAFILFFISMRVGHKRRYSIIGKLLAQEELWQRLEDTYYPDQVREKRQSLRELYEIMPSKFSNRKQVKELFQEINEVQYRGDKFFNKRNDAELRQASHRLKQYLQDPIYDKDSCLAVKDRLDIELAYFQARSIGELPESDFQRLKEAKATFMKLINQPHDILAFNNDYLIKKIEDALFKDSFWSKFRSQYQSMSIASVRDRWGNDYQQLRNSHGNSLALGTALYQFYINRIERIRQSPQKFLQRKPQPKRHTTNYSTGGGFRSGSGGFNSGGSSGGSSFGGGSFGGGGATGSW